MSRAFFVLGALSACVAVGLGAFGAHGLRARLTPDLLATFEVGVRYQMYHALALLAVAWAAGRWTSGAIAAAGILFVAGTIVFSGASTCSRSPGRSGSVRSRRSAASRSSRGGSRSPGAPGWPRGDGAATTVNATRIEPSDGGADAR